MSFNRSQEYWRKIRTKIWKEKMAPGKNHQSKHRDSLPDTSQLDSNVSCELQVPTVSDVIFKYTWRIRKYNRAIAKRDALDSPIFECSVNGVVTRWMIGIRFWRGPNGKRITNPAAVCLSLVSCSVGGSISSASSECSDENISSQGEQARIRFQLGILDAGIRHWELCPVSRVALHLSNTTNMLSVGYRDMNLEDRHVDKDGDLCLMIKLQLVPTEVERHTLSQDLGRLMADGEDADTVISCANGEKQTFYAHSCILKARSSMFAAMLKDEQQSGNSHLQYKLDLSELSEDVVHELLRYIYTDKVDNLDVNAPKLLSLAHRFYLDGLTELCERALVETLTPNNVGNVLLLADQCNCAPLKRAALAYCEENVTSSGSDSPIGKSLAWRVMELVNPELFYEACDSSMGSSHSSNLDSQGSRSDDQM